MKKVVCLILAVLMLLSMTACGASEGGAVETTETKAPGFRVGYGKANITPETGVPMGGYGRSDQRISTGTLSYLWATCIAITDADDNTILLYGLDLCNSAEAYNHFAVDVSKATDVPLTTSSCPPATPTPPPTTAWARSPAFPRRWPS